MAVLERVSNGDFSKIWDRSRVVDTDLVGSLVGVYNGNKFIMVRVESAMVGYKLGSFSFTRRTEVQHKKKV